MKLKTLPNTVIHVGGPTASGKTNLAIELAQLFETEIISSDSRQLYKEMSIGTAVPSAHELGRVKHHFIHSHSVHHPISAGAFALSAKQKIDELHKTTSCVIVVGGSPLYSDALLYGLDDFPSIPKKIIQELELQEIGALYKQLTKVDPKTALSIDRYNPRRIIRALSISLYTGKPYHSYFNTRKPQFEHIIEVGIEWPRERLYERINRRVDLMINQGLIEEARVLHPLKELSSLQTVGYQELFEYFEEKLTLDDAVDKIKQHSRNFAKRQLTWYRKKKAFKWFPAQTLSTETILKFLKDSQLV
ncbi:MAG: tRNA (adenosine(37)-N6)-dimethylallyltransferase MiaA [Bacteroidetes bacterium]|nr:tRNA (adenosine(37)-N6)-dimethylallyltransferase MiaA [Bacteroidota bacterium]